MTRTEELQLKNWFTHHPPKTDEQVTQYSEVRKGGLALASLVMDEVPPGEEREMALEKIREAVMWANAGIACGESSADTAPYSVDVHLPDKPLV